MGSRENQDEGVPHLLSISSTGHLLEYLDLASPILEEPAKVENGHAIPPGPGIGLQWDEDAVKKFST